MTPVDEVYVQTKICECVDAGLKQLGPNINRVIYFHVENKFHIKKEEIPSQPEAFSKALHSIFGSGAIVLERLIVQKIQEKFKLRLKPKTSLVEAIQTAKRRGYDFVGEPIYFITPLNEAGVILLFSKIMGELGIYYEASPSTFPDMIARRKTKEGLERIRVEFEYKSSHFLRHRHDVKNCDVIVCWEHDWRDCPLEVIELKDVIERFLKHVDVEYSSIDIARPARLGYTPRQQR